MGRRRLALLPTAKRVDPDDLELPRPWEISRPEELDLRLERSTSTCCG